LNKARAASAILVTLAIIFGGCGTSSSSDPIETKSHSGRSLLETPLTPTSLSKLQYVGKANAVCRADLAEVVESFAEYKHELGPSVSDQKLFAGASYHFILPSLQIEFDHLHYLGAPTSGEPQVENILAALQRAIYAGQKQRVTSSKELETIFARYNRLARQFGTQRCPVVQGLFAY